MKHLNQETIESLRILIRAYYDYERERIALDGRLGIKKMENLKKELNLVMSVCLCFSIIQCIKAGRN